MISYFPFFGTPCCTNSMLLDFSSLPSTTNALCMLSPAQAEWLVIFGNVSQKQAPLLQYFYDFLPPPKQIIHLKGCKVPLSDYATVQDLNKLFTVTYTVEQCSVSLDDLFNFAKGTHHDHHHFPH